jgi:hypothetical protein
MGMYTTDPVVVQVLGETVTYTSRIKVLAYCIPNFHPQKKVDSLR